MKAQWLSSTLTHRNNRIRQERPFRPQSQQVLPNLRLCSRDALAEIRMRHNQVQPVAWLMEQHKLHRTNLLRQFRHRLLLDNQHRVRPHLSNLLQEPHYLLVRNISSRQLQITLQILRSQFFQKHSNSNNNRISLGDVPQLEMLALPLLNSLFLDMVEEIPQP